MKTLEQVIMDASGLGIREPEAAAIAEAVREWLIDHKDTMPGFSYLLPQPEPARIKELEAEVARMNGSRDVYMAALDGIRAKFPFLPGEGFWTLFQESVCKWTVEKIWFNDDGRLCLTGYRERANGSILESPRYKASECYPTPDACKAAIPVEEK